ncbi:MULTISPECIES: hypothetical protein [Actinosynnema]|nr:hypothetical protein [Actinosynnema pretiosum]
MGGAPAARARPAVLDAVHAAVAAPVWGVLLVGLAVTHADLRAR